jgi:predicted HAD superfamily Cof-like phosphohydrolase
MEVQMMIDAVRAFHEAKKCGSKCSPTQRSELLGNAGDELKDISEALLEEYKDTVADGNENQRLLRVSGMVEELSEYCKSTSDVEAFDALLDQLYFLIGTFVVHDFPMEAGFAEVHQSNMSKAANGGKRLQDKGSAYKPPDLKAVLAGKAVSLKPASMTMQVQEILRDCNSMGEDQLMKLRVMQEHIIGGLYEAIANYLLYDATRDGPARILTGTRTEVTDVVWVTDSGLCKRRIADGPNGLRYEVIRLTMPVSWTPYGDT